MARTKIEWTETTWNPITGCTKISDGCLNCYAENFAKRLQAMGNLRYANGFGVTLHNDLIAKPLDWKKPQMIFVNSMSDIFHEDISDEKILSIFQTMNKAFWHTFQVLTKRSDRLKTLSSKINWTENIWMGVSVENEKYLQRVIDLQSTEAYIKFISAEPLLGALSDINLTNIDWVIVGGESGGHSRPMSEEWVLELKNNCKLHEVAFFFKQWGGYSKKKNGALLQGRLHQDYPDKGSNRIQSESFLRMKKAGIE